MRILQVINSLDIGGAEKLLSIMIPKLISQGFDVDLLIFGKQDETTFLKDTLLKEKVRIIHSGYGIYDLRNIIFIKKIINEYDVFHIHLFPAQYWAAFSKVFSKSKALFITTEHSTSNRRRNIFFFRWIDSFVYNMYSKIICISDSTHLSLINWLKFKDIKKFMVINNGIDLNEFYLAKPYDRQEISSTSMGKKLILMIARFNREKDQSALISAVPLLANDVEVWFIGGGDQKLKRKCENLVEQLNIADKVKFFDKRNDIPKILKTVDLGILSSKWEGFGLVVVEYMASGKPVIASDVEGLKQIVEGAGILFKQGDHNDLAKKIDLVLDNSDIYREMITNGIERSKLYSIENMVQAYIGVYQKTRHS